MNRHKTGTRAANWDQARLVAHEFKLKEIGTRVASITHELKNPASLICGSLQNLGEQVSSLLRYVDAVDSELKGDPRLADLRSKLQVDYALNNIPSLLKICAENGQRLSYVVDQLRVYSRPGPTSNSAGETTSLRGVVEEALRLVGEPPSAEFVCIEVASALVVRGSFEALVLLFGNLIGNAIESTSTGPEPAINVRASRVRGANRVGHVCVTVEDNGPGISRADRSRIFEPFFTTKGNGSGLGLAIAMEIAQRHGGDIEVLAPRKTGAHFAVYLPLENSASNTETTPTDTTRQRL